MLLSTAVVDDTQRQSCRILVALSGGVDSAIAAARLVDAGHEVIGVTFRLWQEPVPAPEPGAPGPRDAVADARRVAESIGIPHRIVDQRQHFAATVVTPFVDAYLSGQTPSPCVYCNRQIKLHSLLQLADELGAAAVATGHYARVRRDGGGRSHLLRSRAGGKDQSYFLYRLVGPGLERLVLPLGDSDKPTVRAEAAARGLPNARRSESQELCFVADGDYAAFVERQAPDRIQPGPLLDRAGQPLGQHGGIHRFTIGQRRGLGVALGHPAFVTRIDGQRQAVTVGTEADILAPGALLTDWIGAEDVSLPLSADVQIRSQHRACAARLTARAAAEPAAGVVVRFDAPVRAISPGQAAVAYHGDRVLGGGRIVRSLDSTAVRAAAQLDPRRSDSETTPE